MAYWNEQFSRKKQKEMFKKKIKKTEHKTPYPMYESVPRSFTTSWQERAEIHRKERMFKIIGGIIISIVFVCGVVGIWFVMEI